MQKFEYVGCFFDYGQLSELVKPIRKNPLSCDKSKPHITFEYMPDKVDTTLFGIEISVNVIGYGNNGENEGLEVTLSSKNEVINEMIKKIEVPHITLSVSNTGKAVNTRYLKFDPIKPFEITGNYNGHISD